MGPDFIRRTVELLDIERIGHGLTAAQDKDLMALLRDRQIPLEVCLTSNVCTGVLNQIDHHPLPDLLQVGVATTLNSDDPAMFGTSLEQEFLLAARQFRLGPPQLRRLCENAVRGSFLPKAEKQILLQKLAGMTSV